MGIANQKENIEACIEPNKEVSAKDELSEAAEDVQPAKGHVVHFYTAMVEFILTFSITIWYTAFTAKDKSRLPQIINST